MAELIVQNEKSTIVPGTVNVTTFFDTTPNTPPVQGPVAISFVRNTIYEFTQAIINDEFSDVDGDLLLTIGIVTLPLYGTLLFDGNPVTIDQEIAYADLADLTYTPSLMMEGSKVDSFLIKVKDDGIAINYWSENATVTFSITNTNTNPTSDDTVALVEYESETIL